MFFVVIEGADGAGKTTVAKALAKKNNWHYTKEPTDSDVGKKVRQLLRDRKEDEALVEAHEDRLQHIKNVILPQLERTPVICDRYFLSTLVYNVVPDADLETWKEEISKEQYRPLYEKVLQPHVIVILCNEGLPAKENDEFKGDIERIKERYTSLAEIIPYALLIHNETGELTETIWEVEEMLYNICVSGLSWD